MHRLLASADVFLENFRDGLLEKQGLGAGRAAPEISASDRRRPQGFSVRSLRAPPGARRGRADDVGAAAMTGTRGQPQRVGIVRQRHHGRHVRRDRDSGGALPEARRHGPAARRSGSRCSRTAVFLSAQHMAVLDDRRGGAPDAFARVRLERLRRVRARGRRAALHRRGERQAVRHAVRRAGCAPISRRSPRSAPTPGRASPRGPRCWRGSRAILRHHPRSRSRPSSRPPALPYAPIVPARTACCTDPHLQAKRRPGPDATDDGGTTDVVLLPLHDGRTPPRRAAAAGAGRRAHR